MFSAAFTDEQISELNKPLPRSATSHRKGGAGKELSYIEGHAAIATANRIFGFGNWGYRALSIEQVVIVDPITGEAIGVEYRATVEIQVRGAMPIVDVGSQPVATVSVEEQCWSRRLGEAKYKKAPVDESPFTDYERKNARAVIMEAHEQAKKAAVTDGMKRGLRAFGSQFGNDLYGPERAPAQSGQASTQGQAGGNVTTMLTVADKLAKSKAQAIERGLVEAGQWEAFKAEKLGAPVEDSAVTQQQYGVLYFSRVRFQQ